MTIERPMRGIGPLVMISSPTQETDRATRLAQELGGKGCRVTLESEREGLGEELDRSLDGMEVFIQLRTKNSGTVAWLDGRLKQAVERQERDRTFVLVPVALDGNTSGTPFGDWVYVDASPQGLGWPSSLDLIARTALSAVHVLPLSKTSGLEFDPEAVRLVLDRVPRDLRRVICDPEDIILSSAKRIVEHARSVEMPIREAVSRQQEEFVLRVEKQLLILDAVLHKLVTELHAQHVGYSAYDLEYHDRAARSIDRFSRLTLWRAVNRLSEWPAGLDERGQALFGTTAAKVLEHIAARSPGDEMHGLASWALGPRRDDGCDEFVEVEVTAPAKAI